MDEYAPFLSWLADWRAGLESIPFSKAVPNPEQAAVLCVDLTVGFAYEGVLSSPRVASIIPPIVQLFKQAYAAGVSSFVLPQDCHSDDTPEFGSFAPHCQCGSREAETVPELSALSFSDQFQVIPKDSINSAINTTLDAWLNAHHQKVDTFIVIGDCTDLCVYQLAMHARLRANAFGYKQRVIVPANCVQTYDLPVDIAQDLGIMPHDGNLMHAIFLYHMALNGVEVVASLV
jgi:nicotinamidase-related amidase